MLSSETTHLAFNKHSLRISTLKPSVLPGGAGTARTRTLGAAFTMLAQLGTQTKELAQPGMGCSPVNPACEAEAESSRRPPWTTKIIAIFKKGS